MLPAFTAWGWSRWWSVIKCRAGAPWEVCSRQLKPSHTSAEKLWQCLFDPLCEGCQAKKIAVKKVANCMSVGSCWGDKFVYTTWQLEIYISIIYANFLITFAILSPFVSSSGSGARVTSVKYSRPLDRVDQGVLVYWWWWSRVQFDENQTALKAQCSLQNEKPVIISPFQPLTLFEYFTRSLCSAIYFVDDKSEQSLIIYNIRADWVVAFRNHTCVANAPDENHILNTIGLAVPYAAIKATHWPVPQPLPSVMMVEWKRRR